MLRRVFSLCCCAPGHHGSNGMAIMVSILVVVIVCTLFYCVYCWRWRKRNGELALAFTFRSFVSNIYGAVVAFALA